MKERRISGQGQILVYLGKCFRMFVHEKQWKNFISSLLIILIISLVTGDKMFVTYGATNTGVFAVISACIWAGLFNSIRSVCRERDILKREYRTGLRLSSYVFAHVIYEMFLCAVEAVLVLAVICIRNHSHLPPEGAVMGLIPDLYLTLFLVTFNADMIALLISCIVRNENSAMTVMPFVLVIQLVMSGVIFDLGGLAEIISYVTASRWGVDGIIILARSDMSLNLQAIGAGLDYSPGSLPMDWLRLLGISAACILIAILVLRLVDRDKR